MLQQTAVEASDNDRTAFKLNGKNISLGENINIIRNKDKNNLLSLSFVLDADSAIGMMSGIKAVFFHSLERLFVYSGINIYSLDDKKEMDGKIIENLLLRCFQKLKAETRFSFIDL